MSRRRKPTLPCVLLVAAVVLFPLSVSAFKPSVPEPYIPSILQRGPDNQRQVVVLDNEYLDRRFGRDRDPEASEKEQSPPMPQAAFATANRAPVKALNPWSPNRSLLTAIDRATPPRRAAALRLAETGRLSLQNGHKRKAIYYLEKALSVEANPLIYYHLARAHYQVADYRGSMRFLEVAEAGFSGQPEWVSELTALRAALASPAAEPSPAKRNVAWTFND